MVRLRQLWVLAWLVLAVCWTGPGSAHAADTAAALPAAAPAAPALLVDGAELIALWPAVTLRRDATHQLSLQQVLAAPGQFAKPTGTPGNLGRTTDTVWLRVPLQVAAMDGQPAQPRVLEINYPTLNEIDVYLLRHGQVVLHSALGSHLRVAQRPVQSRAMAVPLQLPPGAQELVLRVRTQSSMVLPLTLHSQQSFMAQESNELLLLGLLTGAALCMLVYSVAHWLTLREPMFVLYAGIVGCNLVFMLAYFGIGQQLLWPDWPDFAMRVAPMAILLSAACGSGFARASLDMHDISPLLDRLMRWLGVAALLVLVGGLLGLPYPLLQRTATLLGTAISLLTLPVIFVRVGRGDRAARYLLLGQGSYGLGAAAMFALLMGAVEPTFWMQHVFPLTNMLEMAAWMGVLGLKVQAIHRQADRTRVESETLRKLAHTDALTGLPNRRGLQERLNLALQSSGHKQLLAVYLLDLDGFKPVNDRFGHDVGDALLVAVGQRVQAQLRGSDVVARLGGDEFVVLASGLADEAAAHALGSKMLAAFDAPFVALGQSCAVGLTIGYALAPLDSQRGDDLLKRADAAMYAGKQAGRKRVTRGGRAAVSPMACEPA